MITYLSIALVVFWVEFNDQAKEIQTPRARHVLAIALAWPVLTILFLLSAIADAEAQAQALRSRGGWR